jgi:hypothetical protein
MNNDVQFDADQQQFKPHSDMNSGHKSGLIGLLIKIGWAKDEAGANKMMVFILIINLILIYLIVHYFL